YVLDTTKLPNGATTLAYVLVGTDGARYSNTLGQVTVANVSTNTTAPSISGSPVAGQTLVASAGSWTGSPGTFSYPWPRCRATRPGPAAPRSPARPPSPTRSSLQTPARRSASPCSRPTAAAVRFLLRPPSSPFLSSSPLRPCPRASPRARC